jgi:NhaP-type Na+/H+ or K+/H+ antiporter
MIFILLVAATLITFVVRVLFRELLVPVLLLFIIGYTIIWINGPPNQMLESSTHLNSP